MPSPKSREVSILSFRHFPPVGLIVRKLPLAAALLLLTALLSLNTPTSARSANPDIELHICPTEKSPPCPGDVELRVGDRAVLDLLLTAENGAAANTRWLVGWELHLQLTGAAAVEVAAAGNAGRPVQERGDRRLFLDDWLPLRANARTANRRYYRIQNSYNSATGRLDYSIVLAGYSTEPPIDGLQPLAGDDGLLLGRITLRAITTGEVELRPGAAATSFQAAVLTPEGKIIPLTARARSLTVDVLPEDDPILPPPILRGRVWSQSIRGQDRPRPFNRPLTLTFWQAGAVPPWRGGTDRPLAIFSGLTADSTGRFAVRNLPPNVRPGETYDLRVKGLGTLSALNSGITIPTGSANPLRPLLSVDFSPLRDGDISGDNRVENSDVAALSAAFGYSETAANFNPAADFNVDGVVDGQDFSRLGANFNQVGQ